MSFYIIIDIVLVILTGYLTVYSYKKKIYLLLVDYFKVFLVVSLSAEFASKTGYWLSRLYIIKADTYTTLILIGFLLNVAVLVFLGTYAIKYSKKYIKNMKTQKFLMFILTTVEIIIIVTFALYIIMQLTPFKKFIYPLFAESYTYPHIRDFYIKFLNDDFLKIIFDPDTRNYEEVIFKSIKSSL